MALLDRVKMRATLKSVTVNQEKPYRLVLEVDYIHPVDVVTLLKLRHYDLNVVCEKYDEQLHLPLALDEDVVLTKDDDAETEMLVAPEESEGDGDTPEDGDVSDAAPESPDDPDADHDGEALDPEEVEPDSEEDEELAEVLAVPDDDDPVMVEEAYEPPSSPARRKRKPKGVEQF